MRTLLALTYYRPHISGLTIYVERLARALAERGHHVTVLTSRYDRDLPRREEIDGVHVVRVPVAFRVSKGVVMPTYGIEATRQVLAHDVLSIHLPQLDAWGLVLRGRLFHRPSVLTYHCDLRLPPGALNRAAGRAVDAANAFAARYANRIVAYTADYAEHSPLLRRHAPKLDVIGPPVIMPPAADEEVAAFRARHAPGGGPLIGFAARFAAEKGVDTLLAALPSLLEAFPQATVLFAGAHEGIVGEEEYRRALAPAIDALGAHWRFLGPLDPDREMSAFFHALDVLVVPSVNSTESFGLVQVEAMLCGTPVVASGLPGVRQPVRMTGMGEIVSPGQPAELAAELAKVLREPAAYRRPRSEVAALFDPTRTVDAYEELFERQVAAVADSRRRPLAGRARP
jgi:glycosyltransferase involved in cell wall biosynthesis